MGRGKRTRAGSAGVGSATPRLPFNPTVSFGDDEVVINLPELSLIGVGSDFEAAKADLIDELHTYAEQFRASPALQRASNRTTHRSLLQWLEAAEQEGRLEELLFAAPGDEIPHPPARAYTRLIGDNVGFDSSEGNDSIRRLHQARRSQASEE